MPVRASKKRYSPKNRRYRTKKTYAKRSSFATRVKRVLHKQSETKFHITTAVDSNVYGNTLNSPDNYTAINDLAEGATENRRVGNKIRPFLLNVRGQFHNETLNPIICKYILVEHNANNDPRLDLFENDGGVMAPATQDLRAIYARLNTNKYKVLKTGVVHLGNYSGHAHDIGSTRMFNFTTKLSGVYQYQDASVICTERRLSFIPFFRETSNNTAHAVSVTFNAKMYYKDI